MNKRLIGGMFGLADADPSATRKSSPPFLKDAGAVFFVNARSAMNALVTLLKPNRIWMPSFLCDAMIKAVPGFDVRFYEVDERLHISRGWLNNVERGELIVFIDYFGIPFDPSLAERVRQRGGWALEDASQALLSPDAGTDSDFVLFSPRKFVGVPDGGILRGNPNFDLSGIRLESPPAEWQLKALNAARLRREFDLHGGERTWFQLFREIEDTAPVGPYAMSATSKSLLEYGFDYPAIARKRIENYRMLDAYLNQFALFPTLPSGAVPLGYPIRLANRDSVRQKLFDNEIYPPVHWLIKDIVSEEFTASHLLSDAILTLVCDQRYNPTDMERTAKIVLQAAGND